MKVPEILNKVAEKVLAYRPSRKKKAEGLKRFVGKKTARGRRRK